MLLADSLVSPNYSLRTHRHKIFVYLLFKGIYCTIVIILKQYEHINKNKISENLKL